MIKHMLPASVVALMLTGCLGGTGQSVKQFLPGGLDSSRTVLDQSSKQYSPGLLALGLDRDRYHNQSSGLGLIDHPEAELYINQQLDRLKLHSGITGIPGRAYLFADTAFGARSTADGNIYIPFVVLKDLDSTDELAALLAHELAHTIRNHNSTDLFVEIQKKAVMATALFASLKDNDAGVSRAVDQQRMEDAITILLVSDGFINPGWTRRQELEADKLGLDLLIAAGYNSEAMFTLLEKMNAWEELNEQQQQKSNALVENALRSMNLTSDTGALANTLNGLFSTGAGAVGAVVDRLNLDHDSAEKRYDSLLAYTDAHHADAPVPVMERDAWRRLTDSARTRDLWRALISVADARQAIAQRDYRQSEKLLRSAVTSNTNNQNFLRQTFYELREAQGKPDSMEQNLSIGLQGKYTSLMMHLYQAQLNATKQGSVDKSHALALLNEFDAHGRPPSYYQRVLPLTEAAGLTAETLALSADCLARYAGEGVACGPGGAAANADVSYDSFVKGFFKK